MQNATSAPGASLIPDTTDAFTTAHLAIIAILAVLTIIAIAYGVRLKRQRKAAETELEERQDEIEAHEEAPSASPAEPAPSAPAAATRVEPIAADDPLADQPIAAVAPMEADPVGEAVSPDAGPTPVDEADGPVTQLKGLGPKVAARLAELGVTTVGQIAALDDDAATRLDADLGAFRGRMARDRWIEQARFLVAGDRAGFEAVFGKL